MNELAFIFLAGFAGSMHCVGMCGGFVCGLGADPRGAAATLRRQLLYNWGRVTSYCFLGALVGYLGLLLVGHGGENSGASLAQRALALVSGALMVVIGLQFFGFFRRLAHPFVGAGGAFLTQALRDLLRAPGPATPLAFGVLNGLLPCPLVYAFAAQAAASGGPLPGMLVMAAFGLGTFPAMLASAWLGLRWRRTARDPPVQTVRAGFLPGRGAARFDWRANAVRIAGGFIVVLGLITVARGLVPMAAHLH